MMTAPQKSTRTPFVDPALCLGDRECLYFCPTDVFDFPDNVDASVAARPQDCIDTCDACLTMCRGNAIRFLNAEQNAEISS